MKTMRLEKPSGFRLAAAAEFYAGFVPGSGMAAAAVDHLTLVFRLDQTFEAVAVALHEEGDAVVAEWSGTDDAPRLRQQIARMLGLDQDGAAWRAVGARDLVVGKLQAAFDGFFTAAKASPYDAAAWGVLSPRMSVAQAAALKMAISETHGDVVRIRDRAFPVFPSPAQALAIHSLPGVSNEKLERLKGIARAALAGQLDPDRLRAMNEDDALAELQSLRGVGPWTASHILFRGAAPPDALPTAEPRVLDAFGAAYGVEAPTEAAFARASEAWRPFRMWVCILLMRNLHRTGRWQRPGLAAARAEAGRRVKRRSALARSHSA